MLEFALAAFGGMTFVDSREKAGLRTAAAASRLADMPRKAVTGLEGSRSEPLSYHKIGTSIWEIMRVHVQGHPGSVQSENRVEWYQSVSPRARDIGVRPRCLWISAH